MHEQGELGGGAAGGYGGRGWSERVEEGEVVRLGKMVEARGLRMAGAAFGSELEVELNNGDSGFWGEGKEIRGS